MNNREPIERMKLCVRGAVQGVGFRPFVYRLAKELALTGWVNNSPQGVFIEVEGGRVALEKFRFRLEIEKPPRSFIQSLEAIWLDATGFSEFEIRPSETHGARNTLVMADLATCPDCLREIFDPADRHHQYPFTNCTNCGPRFSIIEALPYDRASTSMRGFKMCPACQAEYDDPGNRRFHAQPNACPVCGPRLELWNPDGKTICKDHNALLATAQAVRDGKIVAIKGIGGFHLFADARSEVVVQKLRDLKHREEKPFALMFSSLDPIEIFCEVSPLEARLLRSPESPIVLLHRRQFQISNFKFQTASGVAPGNPNLGAMLPSNPLHHLLMAELNFPVIATSGNLSDEPICIDEHEALERLHGVADLFLVHNRPIVRHVDDSIVRVMLDREMILRRARGYAPLPIQLPVGADVKRLKREISNESEPPHVGCCKNVLAVGAQLKNAVALAVGEQVFLSQHIGDLETEQANNAFRRAAADLPKLFDAAPEIVAADLHPDYFSTRFATEHRSPARRVTSDEVVQNAGLEACAPQVIQVQHHIAHALSCLAENEVELPALGVAWDGTGYGTDGTIWGGEFFRVTDHSVERIARLRPFLLPGGEAAAREPRRAALGLLHELMGEEVFQRSDLPPVAAFSPTELRAMQKLLSGKINSPITSSIGRLFDVVASLLNLRQKMHFESQAAMELEFALEEIHTDQVYSFPLIAHGEKLDLDWLEMIESILLDVKCGVAVGEISATFHNTLAEVIVRVAMEAGLTRVTLSGGCFQNRYLTERAVRRLRESGFQPYWHQRVPTNDGGIALGQVVAARRQLATGSTVFTPLLHLAGEAPAKTISRITHQAPG